MEWVGKSSLKLLEGKVAEEYMAVGAFLTEKRREGSKLLKAASQFPLE